MAVTDEARGRPADWAISHFAWWREVHTLDRAEDAYEGWVYFVRAGKSGPVKIGYSRRDVQARITNLQVACPYELDTICLIRGDIATEKFLHRCFHPWRIRGEWFRGNAHGLQQLVDDMNSRLPV